MTSLSAAGKGGFQKWGRKLWEEKADVAGGRLGGAGEGKRKREEEERRKEREERKGEEGEEQRRRKRRTSPEVSHGAVTSTGTGAQSFFF